MDEVILNDISATTHVHYLQGEDWAFILVMIVAIAAIIFLGTVLGKYLRKKGSLDSLKKCWKRRLKSIDIWLSKHSRFNRFAKKTVDIRSNIGIYLLLIIFVFGASD